MKAMTRAAVLTAMLISGPLALAADPCDSYKWDVSREVRLYATAPTALASAADAAHAPAIAADTHYRLTLLPQEQVRYAVPPSKRMLADGAFGGVLKLRVAQAGAYRIAIDSGFWLDMVHDGQSLPALDFNGVRDCVGPHKIVVYELPAGTDLTLQIASASTSNARLTVTPVAAAAP